MKNPYSLVFGIEPEEYISRLSQEEEIINSISSGTQRMYMITGVRGSGKTVFMTEIKEEFEKRDDWVVVELSTERDMLSSLAGKLNSKRGLNDISDIEVALQKMLEALKKHNRQLLVVVDEAVDNKEMREFASVFQILLRDKLPINLIMTGLYENIDDLQNEKNLTFLYRTPKVFLNPLSVGTMADSYRRNLGVDTDTSIKMAQLTRGFPYAFQVLGSLAWDNDGDYVDIIPKFKQYLEEYVYGKIWSEISEKDKAVLNGIAKVPSGKILEIRNLLNLEANEFAPYKKRLLRKGLISDERGYAKLTLPLFDEFIKENYY